MYASFFRLGIWPTLKILMRDIHVQIFLFIHHISRKVKFLRCFLNLNHRHYVTFPVPPWSNRSAVDFRIQTTVSVPSLWPAIGECGDSDCVITQVEFSTGLIKALLIMIIVREHSDSISPSAPLLFPKWLQRPKLYTVSEKGKRWGKGIISMLTNRGPYKILLHSKSTKA